MVGLGYALVEYSEDNIYHVVKKSNIIQRTNGLEAKYSDGMYYPALIIKEGGKWACSFEIILALK